jgi:hypothetical protein
VIVYSWAEAEKYWPAAEVIDAAHPFAPASGLDLFLAAQRRLDRLGVRVPGVLLADDSRQRHPADVAVVEDVPGGTLEALLKTDPARAALRPGWAFSNGATERVAIHANMVLARADEDLAEAAERDPRIGSAAASLHERLQELAARVAPRTRHGLIHGELGPDHVLVDASGHPVLIGVEGLMFFDVEWEHVFLELRFGDQYPVLSRPGLDPARLGLYRLAMRLSLVAGLLRLLDGDFPHPTLMREIAEHNAKEALALLVR